jgi:hypothetical protein
LALATLCSNTPFLPRVQGGVFLKHESPRGRHKVLTPLGISGREYSTSPRWDKPVRSHRHFVAPGRHVQKRWRTPPCRAKALRRRTLRIHGNHSLSPVGDGQTSNVQATSMTPVDFYTSWLGGIEAVTTCAWLGSCAAW